MQSQVDYKEQANFDFEVEAISRSKEAHRRKHNLLYHLRFLLLGTLFGIVLAKGEVISWFRIQEMFRFQSFHMYGVIGSAVVTGIISIWIIKRFHLKSRDGEPITFPVKHFHKGQIFGGLLFGFGWALTGACPGPLFAQIGAGFSVVIVGLLSAIAAHGCTAHYNISYLTKLSAQMIMYFVALVLPEELNQEILKWKHYIHERYQCKVGLKSPAHITLVPPFWLDEVKENNLLGAINRIAEDYHPFTIETKNFSAFKPRTIFIDVEKNEKLSKLKDKVDIFFKDNETYNIKTDDRPFHPHITIATRDLFKKSFYEVWPVFEKEKFEKQWEATEISVLRHNKKKLGCGSYIPISIMIT